MQKTDLIKEIYEGVFEDELLEIIIASAIIMPFKEDDILIDFGQPVTHIPLLISGAIKIMREDFDMGELLLYFIESGDTCAVTLECCMRSRKSEIRAIAEMDGMVAMIPNEHIDEWMGKYKSWQNFIFSSYSRRFYELLNIIDHVAFMHMDQRLYNYLRESSRINESKIVNKTHQEIANELNSSRVVVSRLLKEMERGGEIKLNRNSIELLT